MAEHPPFTMWFLVLQLRFKYIYMAGSLMTKQTNQHTFVLTERFSVFQLKLYLQQAAVVSDITLHVQQAVI